MTGQTLVIDGGLTKSLKGGKRDGTNQDSWFYRNRCNGT